jgi:hypothetical protein
MEGRSQSEIADLDLIARPLCQFGLNPGPKSRRLNQEIREEAKEDD